MDRKLRKVQPERVMPEIARLILPAVLSANILLSRRQVEEAFGGGAEFRAAGQRPQSRAELGAQ